LESSSRFGGWVSTKTYPDGCFFELGPRTVRPVGVQGRRTLMLVSELGLDHKIIPVTYRHPIVSKRLLIILWMHFVMEFMPVELNSSAWQPVSRH